VVLSCSGGVSARRKAVVPGVGQSLSVLVIAIPAPGSAIVDGSWSGMSPVERLRLVCPVGLSRWTMLVRPVTSMSRRSGSMRPMGRCTGLLSGDIDGSEEGSA